MSHRKKTNKARGRERHLRVIPDPRAEPDLNRIAKSLVSQIMREAEEEAELSRHTEQ